MKKIGLLGCALLVSMISFGQAKKKGTQKKGVATKNAASVKQTSKPTIAEEIPPNEKSKIDKPIEVLAEYPGGTSKLIDFLSKNIKYPQAALESGVKGRVVVSFKVCTDGQLCDLKVVKGLSKETEEESIRVIKLMDKWKPALRNGKPVACIYSLPINFMLEE
jgi:protein TonB